MRIRLRSKLLWSDERDDEIDRERERYGETDEGIEHEASSSEPIAERGVGAEREEAAEAESDEDEIEHGVLRFRMDT